MANTDRKGTMKRSRADSGDKKQAITKSTKKRKKQRNQSKPDKKKDGNSGGAGESSSTKDQEITATAEGLEMTQVLSTLNRLEQSRFEAFRRSTLPRDAVADFVAHQLLLHNEHLVGRQERQGLLFGVDLAPPNGVKQFSRDIYNISNRPKSRPLADLVSPGHADSIVVVVTSLAKAYAQRLVTAARRVACTMGYPDEDPLTVEHIEQAFSARVAAGIDPGFFLQRNQHHQNQPQPYQPFCGKIAAAAVGQVDRHDMLRKAALAAQEEYDRYQKDGKSTPPPLAKEEIIATEIAKPRQVSEPMQVDPPLIVNRAESPIKEIKTAPKQVQSPSKQVEAPLKPAAAAAAAASPSKQVESPTKKAVSLTIKAEPVSVKEEEIPMETEIAVVENKMEELPLADAIKLELDDGSDDDDDDDDDNNSEGLAPLEELEPHQELDDANDDMDFPSIKVEEEEETKTTVKVEPRPPPPAPPVVPPRPQQQPLILQTAAPPKRTGPMSMEDALLNDLDDDDSSDDD